jgi:hypothetical protein
MIIVLKLGFVGFTGVIDWTSKEDSVSTGEENNSFLTETVSRPTSSFVTH